jgi:hypothetical protein
LGGKITLTSVPNPWEPWERNPASAGILACLEKSRAASLANFAHLAKREKGTLRDFSYSRQGCLRSQVVAAI